MDVAGKATAINFHENSHRKKSKDSNAVQLKQNFRRRTNSHHSKEHNEDKP